MSCKETDNEQGVASLGPKAKNLWKRATETPGKGPLLNLPQAARFHLEDALLS